MKNNYLIYVLILLLVLTCFIIYYKTLNGLDKDNVINKNVEESVITKDNILIDKLYLEKCETTIADKNVMELD